MEKVNPKHLVTGQTRSQDRLSYTDKISSSPTVVRSHPGLLVPRAAPTRAQVQIETFTPHVLVKVL